MSESNKGIVINIDINGAEKTKATVEELCEAFEKLRVVLCGVSEAMEKLNPLLKDGLS